MRATVKKTLIDSWWGWRWQYVCTCGGTGHAHTQPWAFTMAERHIWLVHR